MPPLYSCELCGYEIDPKNGTTVRLATCWVRSNGKTVFSIEQEHYRYRHDFCFTKEIREQQETLF